MPLSPDVENLLLGRGRVLFDRFDANGAAQGYIDLGNAPDFSVNISKESLPHYSSRAGIKVKDLEVLKEIASSFQFTLEEFSLLNLALAFLGTTSASNQVAGDVADEVVVAKLDRWVKLAARNLSVVVVTHSTGDPTYTAGSDYVIATDEGMIKCLSTGLISADQSLKVDYHKAALSQNLLAAMQSSVVDGCLKFVGDPATGPRFTLDVWKGKLAPSGEIGFISEDWAKFQLAYEVTKDETGHPTNPYFQITHMD
jgi:hypothetical protein